MLSCTVENKEKQLLSINNKWEQAINLCESNQLLQTILSFLNYKKDLKELNNNGIPRMIKGYFYEIACIAQECYRVLKKNGLMFMINDNVRYAGVSISVDLILSKIAEEIGFSIEKIWVLPNTKGNSSQQMGFHGKENLRKCIYIWRKND
jgi:DNA modification methylase